jgi:hypothetical protein
MGGQQVYICSFLPQAAMLKQIINSIYALETWSRDLFALFSCSKFLRWNIISSWLCREQETYKDHSKIC